MRRLSRSLCITLSLFTWASLLAMHIPFGPTLLHIVIEMDHTCNKTLEVYSQHDNISWKMDHTQCTILELYGTKQNWAKKKDTYEIGNHKQFKTQKTKTHVGLTCLNGGWYMVVGTTTFKMQNLRTRKGCWDHTFQWSKCVQRLRL